MTSMEHGATAVQLLSCSNSCSASATAQQREQLRESQRLKRIPLQTLPLLCLTLWVCFVFVFGFAVDANNVVACDSRRLWHVASYWPSSRRQKLLRYARTLRLPLGAFSSHRALPSSPVAIRQSSFIVLVVVVPRQTLESGTGPALGVSGSVCVCELNS